MKTLLVLTGVTSQMELDEELRSSGPSVRRRGVTGVLGQMSERSGEEDLVPW